ncbi:hypothetical protein HMPREF0519_0301 [Lentilactobacillus hilgardii DSM 20176 = ATCC 8290]|uniref:Uncharacterized protein n=1 Tax=Lentilactobacillus hilgardii (strain ATCC 8290 / DSM 20176 / CCUG 30140 / JCM 1155 / KCTC 3500 / NBRC 15886 / NCIMB 8040 / NRRL B-1843 / 9) TaxID=1423757 RepID=C0XGE0_LENH9|nr:hypothetical protein HMPREF0519_0301 [Lentilactobacillus hilgardii DSM 20176 = ATCC 8290]
MRVYGENQFTKYGKQTEIIFINWQFFSESFGIKKDLNKNVQVTL